ncbi:hypothetical protein NKJ06_34480 [Mesorhizobium sp. M0293]|uniref:hypothetical protein n=1 Tax=Mesorhizobium sp. M0293 TaxID=2956930 RepID=UPI00333A16B5
MSLNPKSREGTPLRPFLSRFAVERTGSNDIPGRYAEDREMWVVNQAGIEVALVSADLEVSELVTKTKVSNEQDDEANMLGTHTAVRSEADDLEMSLAMLSIVTLTEVKSEKDD